MKWLWGILKKIIKRKLFWLAVIIVIIVIVLIARSAGGPRVEYVTERVIKDDLKQTVSETGTIEAASEIDLNFKGTGTITEIFVEEGDEVKKDDVLAKLDAGAVGIQVRQAQANLNIAVANLNRFLAGASAEDISVSQESVDNAKIAYENAKRDHNALIDKLESDIKTYEQAVIDSRDNLITTMEIVMTSPGQSLDVIKVILDDNDLVYNYSAKNTQYGVNSKNFYDQSLPKVLLANNAIDQAKTSLTDEDIENAVNQVLETLNSVKDALDYTFLAVGASLTTYDFTEAEKEAYKTGIKTEQTKTDNNISTVKTGDQAYNNSKINLQIAINNKDLNIANSQSALDSAKGSWDLTQAQLDLKKAKPRGVDIAWYQAQVDQARASYDLSLISLDDYTITAPTDGTIIFVNNEVGEQIGFGITNITEAANAVITILGKGEFEIEVDVPESEIIKIVENDPVKITLDAYGDRVEFQGVVSFIDLAETNIQDVVFYKVKVTLEAAEEIIKPGMTANVDIMTDKKEGVLIIPGRAVKEDAQGDFYVEVLENDKAEKLIIKTGIRGDEGVEVISGLKEGQEVIIFTKEK
jgi:HlyD family secretion protein